MTMITFSIINNHLVKADEAALNVSDLSILRGFAIFDYFLFRQRQPLFLEDYLDRFYRSAKLIHMEIPYSKEEFAAQIFQLIAANGEEEGGIRLLLTGGYSPDSYTPTDPNILILQHPLPANAYRTNTSIRLMTYPYLRDLPEVKTTNYATGIRLIPEMKRRGADDLLYLDGDWVRESARSNFFLVFDDNRVVTARDKVLLGVTRKQILHLAGLRYPVEEREVHISEIRHAREAFFTSSIKGVLPVTQIDDQIIGDGKIGPVASQLQQDFLQHVQNYIEHAKK